MKLQGEHAFAASRALVWQALLDPAVLARVLPGTERLERVGEGEYRGEMNVQVGPVKGSFQGTLHLSDLVPLESYHLKLRGSGPAGFLEGEGDLRLSDIDASAAAGPAARPAAGTTGGTVLRYDLDAQVGGRLAGVGQRLIESSAKSIAKQGLEGLGRELQALAATASPAASATGAPPAAPPPAPTQAQLAARVTGDVVRDLLPAGKRPWVLGAAALALALLLIFAARACAGNPV